MSEDRPDELEERVLVLTPTARDAAITRGLFEAAGVRCHLCATIDDVCREAERGAGMAVVTAEAILEDRGVLLASWLRAQPPWSDFPLIALTPAGAESPTILRALDAVGHMTFMKRPVQVPTLMSTVRGALRDRRRQYAVRELLAERQRAADVLRVERERYRVTLSSIGDAVIATDTGGAVTFLNKVAEQLTGWDADAASGRALDEVFRIVHEGTRLPVPNPAMRALEEGVVVGLANHTILLSRDGSEYPLDDSAAPIRGIDGGIIGSVLVFRDITEKKAAEAAVRESEGRFRALVNATSDVVYRMSADWSKMYPLDGRGLVASNAAPIRDWLVKNLPASAHSRVLTALTSATANREIFELEHEVIRADGSLGWTFSRAIPILDAAGAIMEWFGTARDITEQKRAEEELRDIRSRMEAALAAAAIGTWTWEVPADRFFGDQSLARIFSVPPEDVAGGPIARIMGSIHPDDRDRVGDLVATALEGDGRYEADYRVGQTDGAWRWVTARGQVERDTAGSAIRFPGVVIDVTDRKRAEDDLVRVMAESERRKRLYETVLSATPDFVYIFSLDHRVLYANDALIEMWGRGQDGAIGKTFLEIGYEPWHAEMHDREIDQVRDTKKPIRGEVPFDGTYGRRIYDYIFVPVLGSDGQVEAVAGTTRDVTERKWAEDAIIETDRKKDDFIALLAHELRNPLAPIRNGLQVMRLATGDSEATGRAREMMDRQLSHMVRLIDDLLDVSRISRNKMELRRNRVALSDIVNAAVETALPVIDAEKHELKVSLPCRPVYLDADLTRLAQVFSNLLTNSAKYTERGGTIWMTAERRGGEVVVAVRDTGIGIPAESIASIFDMFSQVDRSVERSTGGLGIGLALVKGLVEMHGGHVFAASGGEGEGSMFTVTLPVLEGYSATSASTTDEAEQGRIGHRILVVDDNYDGAESLAMMLHLMDNEVRTAHDGVAAIELAEAFRPEVILMDVGMPRMNGLDATRRIREQPWGKAITIIALTGWGQDGDKDRSHQAGCDGHLVKPVSLPDLQRLLGELRRA